MKLLTQLKILIAVSIALFSITSFAEFTLTSPAMENGTRMPADLKCTRDGGDGLSPPIAWTGAPANTKSFAVIMHHYPPSKVEGVDKPSSYWLLWNVPTSVSEIARGNPESIGTEGGEKDKRYIGYTPPCSPTSTVEHTYVITVYALDSETLSLGSEDDIDVDWATMTDAIEGKVLEAATFSFIN
jgi:Raf kinase inhibitor-like YbhB/YbcL family protein